MRYKIKKLREALELTQVALAKKSGVSRGLIAGLESGAIKETSTVSLRKLAEALECSISDLFFEEDV